MEKGIEVAVANGMVWLTIMGQRIGFTADQLAGLMDALEQAGEKLEETNADQ